MIARYLMIVHYIMIARYLIIVHYIMIARYLIIVHYIMIARYLIIPPYRNIKLESLNRKPNCGIIAQDMYALGAFSLVTAPCFTPLLFAPHLAVAPPHLAEDRFVCILMYTWHRCVNRYVCCTFMDINISIHIRAYIYTYTHTQRNMYLYIYVYICIYMYHTYIYMYVSNKYICIIQTYI